MQDSDLPFSHKGVVTITHEQNITCNNIHLEGNTLKQAILCRQLFAGHVVGSRPAMKRKKIVHRIIIKVILSLNVSVPSLLC